MLSEMGSSHLPQGRKSKNAVQFLLLLERKKNYSKFINIAMPFKTADNII